MYQCVFSAHIMAASICSQIDKLYREGRALFFTLNVTVGRQESCNFTVQYGNNFFTEAMEMKKIASFRCLTSTKGLTHQDKISSLHVHVHEGPLAKMCYIN